MAADINRGKGAIISIASGKGGTGKTTAVAMLARIFRKRGYMVKMLDCDVDEPNLALHFACLPSKVEQVSAIRPILAERLCTLCGKCEKACRFNAIIMGKERVFIQESLCHSCGGCILACPSGALKGLAKHIGEVETCTTACGISLVSGRSNIGETSLTRIIRQVRRHGNSEYIEIIDSPPGTSCSLAASVEGCDFCLIVAETTEFGIHDMKLLIEALLGMGIPFGILANKTGLGNIDLREFCQGESMVYIGEIPFDADFYKQGSQKADLDAFSQEVRIAYQGAAERILEIIGNEADSFLKR